MTAHGRGPRKLWRPDWTWRLRQLSCFLFVAWFVVLLAFIVTMRSLDSRRRRRWREVAAEMGWTVKAADHELAVRWPFPPFTIDPDPEVLHVTSGSYGGRRFVAGHFRFRMGRQHFGFDVTDLEIDRPLPPMQVAPESLVGLLAPGLRPMDLHVENAGFNDRYRLVRGDRAQSAGCCLRAARSRSGARLGRR